MDPELNRYVKLLVKLGILVLILLAAYLVTAYLLPVMEGTRLSAIIIAAICNCFNYGSNH